MTVCLALSMPATSTGIHSKTIINDRFKAYLHVNIPCIRTMPERCGDSEDNKGQSLPSKQKGNHMIYSDSDIREYFLDNEVPDFTRGEVAEFRSRRAWIKLEDFEPIKIALDRVDLFTYFCNLYDIPYVKDGERLQVLKTGKEAKDDLKAASDALENEGYGWAAQNPRLFRNDRDRTVIVFAPMKVLVTLISSAAITLGDLM